MVRNRCSCTTSSSRWLARVRNGRHSMPAVSNSHFMCPAPRPTSSRPSTSRSVVAISLASSAGFQNSALSTKVPSRIRLVASAAATSKGNGATVPRWSAAKSTS
jgi:hypothetical protein